MCPPLGSAKVEQHDLTETLEQTMSARRDTITELAESPLPVRVRLAAAWTSFMLLYLYVDILGFYLPGTIDDILVGVVWKVEITQVWAITALALMAVPILMVVLSTTLPARANRLTNLVVAAAYVLVSAWNAVGESWTFYYALAAGLEVAVLVLIARYAWTWPRRTASPGTAATGLAGEPLHTQHQA